MEIWGVQLVLAIVVLAEGKVSSREQDRAHSSSSMLANE